MKRVGVVGEHQYCLELGSVLARGFPKGTVPFGKLLK